MTRGSIVVLLLVYNVALLILIGFSIWFSNTLWPLFALIFTMKYSDTSTEPEKY